MKAALVTGAGRTPIYGDFAEPQLWLIEWPERAQGAIPSPDLVVSLSHAGTVREAGFKFGRWLDLAFYQLVLPGPIGPRAGLVGGKAE